MANNQHIIYIKPLSKLKKPNHLIKSKKYTKDNYILNFIKFITFLFMISYFATGVIKTEIKKNKTLKERQGTKDDILIKRI